MTTELPTDFPRAPFTSATLPGAQEKHGARLIEGKYVVGLTEAELLERYLVCADLLQELVPYAHRKLATPGWTRAAVLTRVREGVQGMDTGLSTDEVEWLVQRVDETLG